ncbi:MAG: hypothetical protein CMP81_06135 [Fulvimarina sp.]|nr:hypothetical protein [Fulvimarina sp.]
MPEWLETTLSIVLPLLGTVVVSILIPALVQWMRTNGVLKDEAQARVLQSALANAAETAIAAAGGKKATGSALTIPTAAAVEYVKQSVPGTVAAKGLSDAAINDLVVPHIERALSK